MAVSYLGISRKALFLTVISELLSCEIFVWKQSVNKFILSVFTSQHFFARKTKSLLDYEFHRFALIVVYPLIFPLLFHIISSVNILHFCRNLCES